MYYNVFGEKVSKTRFKEMVNAQKNRRELIGANQFSRRDLMRMGLLSGAGYLVAKSGLSGQAWGQSAPSGPINQAASPPTRSFVTQMPIMPIHQPVKSLTPTPTVDPNTAAGEGRTAPHQALTVFPPQKFYQTVQQIAPIFVSPDLPLQQLYTFDGFSPGPTYVAHYQEPILVRNFNNIPNGPQPSGFGVPSLTTHLHNSHTPSESDGNPCDFFNSGQFYDQHYPNQYAGVLSDFIGQGGDLNEAMSTLWYHDHMIGATAQNVYKGLAGFYFLFNDHDTGNETTGFRLPTFPDFDIPMLFADRVFDQDGAMAFDLMNLDGILGDKFLTNGVVQPFFQVHPRKYRLRWLNTGISRFVQMFLTDPSNLGTDQVFFQIAKDGNLLPQPIQVTSCTLGVAERADVIIDFSQYAGKSLFVENRLQQIDGRGPTDVVLPAGQGDSYVRIDVTLPKAKDNSGDPRFMKFYDLPALEAPRISRTFHFDRLNGQWSINGIFMDCNDDGPKVRVRVGLNTAEHWILSNLSGDWEHPIHIHFEEHRLLSRDRATPPPPEQGRNDVTRVKHNNRNELFFRFRDFHGHYPMHCHNLVHEDHAMMLLWFIDPNGGDNNQLP